MAEEPAARPSAGILERAANSTICLLPGRCRWRRVPLLELLAPGEPPAFYCLLWFVGSCSFLMGGCASRNRLRRAFWRLMRRVPPAGNRQGDLPPAV